jgi:hypothetical protein
MELVSRSVSYSYHVKYVVLEDPFQDPYSCNIFINIVCYCIRNFFAYDV